MGNKTDLIQEIYNRISGAMSAGGSLESVKRLRIGSIEEARKNNDLPIINIQLVSGTEPVNFQNGAYTDNMNIEITLVDNKLKESNNTLFASADDGLGSYIIGNQAAISGGLLAMLDDFNTRTIGTPTGANVVFYETVESGNAVTYSGVTVSNETGTTPNSVGILPFLAGVRERTLNIINGSYECEATVLEYPSGGTAVSDDHLTLSTATNPGVGSTVSILSYLSTLRKRSFYVSDGSGNEIDSFLVVKNATSPETGITVGQPPRSARGPLVLLEALENALDKTTAGVRDVTFNQKANNTREFSYTINEDNDCVEIVLTVAVQTKIFLSGNR